MRFSPLIIFLILVASGVKAQKTQIIIAQNSVAKLQASIAAKEEAKKQLAIIGEGIKAVEAAQTDKKTKNWPDTWAIKSYLSSYVALIDNETNADRYYSLALEAFDKAKELDKYQANTNLIKASLHNINIKKQLDGNSAYKANDFTTAYQLLKEVSDYIPKDTTLAVNVGICAQNIQAYNEALVYYKRAKDNGIKNSAVYQNMANIYASKFETDLAIKTLEDGLKLNPYHPFLTNDYINLLLDNENYDRAVKIVEGSIATEKRSKLLYFLYGYLHQAKMNNNGTAELAYKKALDIDLNYFDALYQLALVYIENANQSLKERNNQQFASLINRAEFTLLRAHEINMNDRNTISLLIDIYTRKNRLDKVQELKRKINEF